MTDFAQNTVASFSVLIPTRNRPENLVHLLRSISNSTILPECVIVVSTGFNISEFLENLETNFQLDYVHADGFGQIHQKIIGIKRVPKNSRWLIFLDDDLNVAENCFEELFNLLYSESESQSIVGVGMADEIAKVSRDRGIKKLFSAYRGKVLKSGTNISYMTSPIRIETEWLNGASMWRTEVLGNYFFEHTQTRYAICEDLIFSHRVKKVGKLIFCPEAIYRRQDSSFQSMNAANLRSLAFWKLYFVSTNAELSKILFFLSFGMTTFKFCTKKFSIGEKWYAIVTLSLLFKSILTNEDPLCALKRLEI